MKWLLSLFSEESGKASWGRIGSAIALGMALRWVDKLVSYNHAFPDFSGVTVFVISLFGISAAKAVANGFKNGNGK